MVSSLIHKRWHILSTKEKCFTNDKKVKLFTKEEKTNYTKEKKENYDKRQIRTTKELFYEKAAF